MLRARAAQALAVIGRIASFPECVAACVATDCVGTAHVRRGRAPGPKKSPG